MIEFHTLKESDIELIVAMMQDFYAIDNYPIQPETTKKLFKTFIDDENLGQCWLILHDEVIVGYVILTYIFSFEYQGRIAFLDELYLNEKARGKGIGKITLEFIHDQALQKELKIIYLEIESHNAVAKKLYLSGNFIVHNRQLMQLKPKP
ncbi:GNAT family N-acetyltransferase [Flavobacterium sp. SM2513]|uniref:GNAT family N-acetyltransferase n=1 Tax=Flavobacterium sp. SM2513 TaxID=3424766 RepID=UPI003D7F68D8